MTDAAPIKEASIQTHHVKVTVNVRLVTHGTQAEIDQQIHDEQARLVAAARAAAGDGAIIKSSSYESPDSPRRWTAPGAYQYALIAETIDDELVLYCHVRMADGSDIEYWDGESLGGQRDDWRVEAIMESVSAIRDGVDGEVWQLREDDEAAAQKVLAAFGDMTLTTDDVWLAELRAKAETQPRH